MRKFIVERDMPKVGTLARKQLQEAVLKSRGVIDLSFAEMPET
jgi:hypothetical protein